MLRRCVRMLSKEGRCPQRNEEEAVASHVQYGAVTHGEYTYAEGLAGISGTEGLLKNPGPGGSSSGHRPPTA